MKKFYLLRHEDVNGNSGTGVVAEGVIFDHGGMCAMTWLTSISTITMFRTIKDVITLHGHDGKTQVILEGRKKHEKLFSECAEKVKLKKAIGKNL
jgi:hypothetical protein